MAHEKTWQYALNLVLGDVSSAAAQADWFMWKLKEFLLGYVPMTDQSGAAIGSPSGLWSLTGSSDGVAAGLDGVDRLGGRTFDATRFVRAAAGTAHSWVVFYNSVLNVWLIIDFASTATNMAMVTICYTAPSGGSVTARPTASDEMASFSSGLSFIDTVAGVDRHVHYSLATDGSFFALNSRDGTGLVSGIFAVHKFVEVIAGDNYPVMTHMEFSTSGVLRSGPLLTSSSGTTIKTSTNVVVATAVALLPYLGGSSYLVLAASLPPNQNGKLSRFILKLGDTTSGRIKGRCQDWFLAPKSTLDTDSLPASGTPTDAHVGCTILPVNAALSL